MTAIEYARLAGLSAFLAATMTVVGMITLMLFFSRGGRWGTYNDAASVVLMLALIPVALVLAVIQLEVVTTTALAVAALGIAAMVALAVLQGLVVIGRVTYAQTKTAVLTLGGIVGVWYLLTAISTGSTDLPDGLRVVAAMSGIGFIAVGLGFALGSESHPLSIVGGLVLFVASLVFQVWLGALLLGGDLSIPSWNL